MILKNHISHFYKLIFRNRISFILSVIIFTAIDINCCILVLMNLDYIVYIEII